MKKKKKSKVDTYAKYLEVSERNIKLLSDLMRMERTKAQKDASKKREAEKSKAEALIRKFAPVYKKLEKNDLIDAKDLLHEILGINCDCYHFDW